MAITTAAIQFIYLFVTLMGFGLAILLWRNPGREGTVPLTVVNLGLAWWSLCLLVSMLVGDQLAVLAIRFMYFGVVAVPVVMFVFGLIYTGRERFVTNRNLAVIALHPVITLFFVFFNPGNLFFEELDPGDAMGVEQVWGPAFFAHSLVSYLFVAGLTLMILELLFKSDRTLYRGQALTLILAIVAPLVSNAVFITDVVSFDTTPIGFGVSTALFTFAIFRYRLVDVAPIARDKVVDNIRDGMFVIDVEDRIVDTNPAGRDLVGLASGELVGSSVAEIFADFPQIVSTYEEMTAEPTAAERTLELGDLFLNIEATPIEDDRGRHVAWLVITADVSEEKRSKRQLEQQIEKLDQFASLVSHDLRNPINVARGYVEQTRATGDMEHLETTEDALNRMEAIIDDVLALAREGQDVTEPTETSLDGVARAAWSNVDTGEATLEIADDAETTVLADADRLQRLLENLFRNSIEHGVAENGDAAAGGDGTADHTVSVALSRETGSELTFVVADDGVGIPPEDHEQVFEDGYTTNEDGTGLGLAIVEQIAQAHGWEVSVSESESGGAAFELSGVGKPMPATA